MDDIVTIIQRSYFIFLQATIRSKWVADLGVCVCVCVCVCVEGACHKCDLCTPRWDWWALRKYDAFITLIIKKVEEEEEEEDD